MGTDNSVNSPDTLLPLKSILKMRSFKFLVFFLLLATVSSASLNSLLDEEGGEVVAKAEGDDDYDDVYYDGEYYDDSYYDNEYYDEDYEEEDDEEENLEEDLEEEQEEDLEEEDLEEEDLEEE